MRSCVPAQQEAVERAKKEDEQKQGGERVVFGEPEQHAIFLKAQRVFAAKL